MSVVLGVPPAVFRTSDEPCLGDPMFTFSDPPEQDPLLLLNRQILVLQWRVQALEEARFGRRCQRGWAWVRRQQQRHWAAVIRFWQKVRS